MPPLSVDLSCGIGSLPAEQGGPGYSNPDEIALLVNSSDDEKAHVDAYVTAEKDDNNWANMDACFVLALTTSDMLIDLKGNDGGLTVPAGRTEPTDAAADGITFDSAADSYVMGTALNDAAFTNFTLTEAFVSFYCQTDSKVASTDFVFGAGTAANTDEVRLQVTSANSMRLRFNNNSNTTDTATLADNTFYYAYIGAGTPNQFQAVVPGGGAAIADGQVTGAGIPTRAMALGGKNDTGTVNAASYYMTMSYFAIGGGVTESTHRANVEALLNALGTTGA